MSRRSLWPRGFTGQVILVLVLAVLVQFVAGSMLIRTGETHIQRADQGKRIAEQLLIAERIIRTADRPDRERLLESLSTIHTRLSLIEGTPAIPPGIDPEAALIATAIFEFEPSLAGHPIRLSLAPGSALTPNRRLAGAIRIEENLWIGFATRETVVNWRLLLETSIRVGLIALFVLGSAALLVRTMSMPLRRLSDNAQLIGTADRIPFDETAGPQEMREVSRALNAMQERLEGVIDQRTQALLAVGHDLRTPLSRLRLRVDAIEDSADRHAALADIGQMTRMLQELLDFFETGENRETRAPTDLSSLCQTIAEAASDLGGEVTYDGPDRLVIEGVHDHLARAIENLVDNAVKYGGAAVLTLSAHGGERGDCFSVKVEDRGPGVPPEQLDRVMRPFERLDASRSDNHPGMGLGLSIAHNVALAHGGRLRLANREGGGLCAELLLAKK
ncbi:MAG: HAMP domain-containing histidine kinase [Erythrobacter sp.]|nr:HAMP domain-containing histidine kinase [Erythrobacter sp.]